MKSFSKALLVVFFLLINLEKSNAQIISTCCGGQGGINYTAGNPASNSITYFNFGYYAKDCIGAKVDFITNSSLGSVPVTLTDNSISFPTFRYVTTIQQAGFVTDGIYDYEAYITSNSSCPALIGKGQFTVINKTTLSKSHQNPTNCIFSNGSITISGLTSNNPNYTIKYTHKGQTASIPFTSSATGEYIMHDLSTGIYSNIQIIVANTSLSPVFADTLIAGAAPTWFSTITTDFNLCEGMTMNIAYANTLAPSGTIFQWFGPNNFQSVPRIDDANFTLLDVATANNGVYKGKALSPDYCIDSTESNLTVIKPSNIAISTGTGTVCESNNTNVDYAPGCSIISKQVPNLNDPNALSGVVNSCVTIDAAVQFFNSQPYVPRHYDIEPAVNPATSTATITLFALQSEFDAYNAYVTANNLSLPLMPTGGIDNGNVRVTQFHGTGSTPGNYTGATEFIVPVVTWNTILNCWEITFPVTGFSGFYIHSGFNPLPLHLIDFKAKMQGRNCVLSWQSSKEENLLNYQVERSYDAVSFAKIGTLNANNTAGIHDYTFSDAEWERPNKEYVFYRLKMIENDGKFKYSSVVKIANKQISVVSIFPNPASSILTITGLTERTEIRLMDIQGRQLIRQLVKAPVQTMDIASLPKGLYLLQYKDGEKALLQKVVKQ